MSKKKTKKKLPHCSGCTNPDSLGVTHQEQTIEHPEVLTKPKIKKGLPTVKKRRKLKDSELKKYVSEEVKLQRMGWPKDIFVDKAAAYHAFKIIVEQYPEFIDEWKELKRERGRLLRQIKKDVKMVDLAGLSEFGSGGAGLLHQNMLDYLDKKLKEDLKGKEDMTARDEKRMRRYYKKRIGEKRMLVARKDIFDHLPKPFYLYRRSKTKPYWVCRESSDMEIVAMADTFQELLDKIDRLQEKQKGKEKGKGA